MHQPAIRFAGIGAALLLVGLAGAPRVALVQERAGCLGVYSQSLNDDLRESMNIDEGGILVTRVVEDSPADRAGLRRGDVIVSVGGHSIDSPSDLMREVRDRSPGTSLTLAISRDGNRRTLSARLGERPDAESNPDSNRDEFDRGDDEAIPPTPPTPPEPPAPPRVAQ